MKLLNTVIYTDKLADIRQFWAKHFALPMDTDSEYAFTVFPFSHTGVEYIDSKWAGVEPTRGVSLRMTVPFTDLELERLVAEGVNCSELKVEYWSTFYGQQVRYFTITDPSGAHIHLYEDHFGEKRQLMTTGDGTDTRKVHQKDEE